MAFSRSSFAETEGPAPNPHCGSIADLEAEERQRNDANGGEGDERPGY
jgi:hypothetical protein